MLLQQYIPFFTATSQAAAALVGLLFIALSIDVGLDRGSRIKQFALSETAFISLAGIFVISLLALLPYAVSLMAGVSVIFSVLGMVGLVRIHRYGNHEHLALDLVYVFFTIGIYLALAGTSVWIFATGGTIDLLNIFCVLFVVLFGLSLIRAWRALKITKRHASAHSSSDSHDS
jgi:hypothetical protein